MQQQRLSKFKRRPEAFSKSQFTDLDIDIIAAIARFRFIASSHLLRIVRGNPKVIHRHLQKLWHLGLINRFMFPSLFGSKEANYYLDNVNALKLWANTRGVEIDYALRKEIQTHGEREYFRISDPAYSAEHQGKLFFAQHELMITRFHVGLQLACKASNGTVALERWIREPTPKGAHLMLPKVSFDQRRQQWIEHPSVMERVPHRPDAFFTLRFGEASDTASRRTHFFYEADRKTMTMPDMRQKLRGYYHFIKKHARHRELYGAHPIRAVLIETLDDAHYTKLRSLLQDGSVCMAGRTGLFWLTVSKYEQEATGESGSAESIIKSMTSPELILKRVWSLPVDNELHSLLDPENRVEETLAAPAINS